ncbi:hypothetical protein CP061683_0157A, partial [Chlamydia psittaci 06-1683]
MCTQLASYLDDKSC